MIPFQKDKRKAWYSSKLSDLVMIKQQAHVFDTSDLQFAFKQGMSTTMCTYLANEALSYYVNNDTTVYTLLLDASKAFDRVNYCMLFNKLIDKGMCPLVIRLLLYIYTNQQLQVSWNDKLSNTFSVRNGVRQGGIMSPLLFGVYIDGLLIKLKASGIGCTIGQKYCGALGYADDIKLLVPTLSGLIKMVKICKQYADRHDVVFNGPKSKLLIYNQSVND